MGLLDQMEFLFLGPWGIAILSSTIAELTYTPTNSVKVFLFLHILSSSVFSRFCNDCHSNWHQMVSQCDFDLCFSNDQWWWALFHMFDHINVFFWEFSVHVLCPLFDGVVCFLVNLFKFLVDSGHLPFVRWVDCNIAFLSVGCLFTLMTVTFTVQKTFSLIRSQLSILAFVAIAFGIFVMELLPMPMSWMVLPIFPSRNFMVLGFTFKSLIHLS